MSKKFALFLFVIVVLFTAFTRGEPLGPKAVEAKTDALPSAQAAPYTRYPRYVQTGEGCGAGDGIAYRGTEVSRGGNTYSEMYYIFANGKDGCPVVRHTARIITPAPVVVREGAVEPTVDVVLPTNTPGAPVVEIITTPEAPVVVVTPEPTEEPEPIVIVTPPTEEEDTCDSGNPGNTKCVGNPGEDPNGRGTMPQDNAGGNGNGEHGNQGQGGNGNNKP